MNYSLTERESATNLEISCAYESDIDRALEIFTECIKKQPRVLKTKEPWWWCRIWPQAESLSSQVFG